MNPLLQKIIFSKPKRKVAVSDTFTRADSTTTLGNAETGPVWTVISSTWGISGNKAYCTNTSGVRHVVLDSGKSNCEVSVDINPSTYAGLVFRATDGNNLYAAVIGTTALNLYKVALGATTTAGSYTFTPGSLHNVKAVLNGDNVDIYLDNIKRISTVDSFNNAATKHGLRSNLGDTTSRFDNFKVVA